MPELEARCLEKKMWFKKITWKCAKLLVLTGDKFTILLFQGDHVFDHILHRINWSLKIRWNILNILHTISSTLFRWSKYFNFYIWHTPDSWPTMYQYLWTLTNKTPWATFPTCGVQTRPTWQIYGVTVNTWLPRATFRTTVTMLWIWRTCQALLCPGWAFCSNHA